MKVIGKGKVTLTTPQDERPHVPGSDPDWQESVVIYVWDPEQKCYAFLRIGHEPNQGPTGTAVVWCNLWTPDRYYRRYEDFPLQPGDRFDTGFASGSHLRYEYHGRHHWHVRDGAVSADFVMEDFHAPFDFLPAGHNLGAVAPHHIEAAGYVSGSITVEGKTFKLRKAVAHRDHSWGIRRWEAMRGHRWAPAIFGEDLVTHAVSLISPEDGSLQEFGFVMRDGEFIVPKEISIASLIESDGLTNRGGVVNYTLDDGEKLEVVYWNVVPGGLSFHRDYPCFDPMSVVTCGKRTGHGLVENALRTLGGAVRPSQKALISGYIDNGIFSYRHGTSFARA